MTTLYHETHAENVASIVGNGFRDTYEPLFNASGVWFRVGDIRTRSDRVLLAIDTDLSQAELESYRRGRQGVKDFEQYFIPAARLKTFKARVVDRPRGR